MKCLIAPLQELRETEELQAALRGKSGVYQVTGCIDSQKLHFIYGIHNGQKRKLIVTYSEQKARELCEEYRFYDENVLYYPAKDLLFYQADVHGNLLVKQRMEVIRSILDDENATIVTTLDGCMDKVPELSVYKNSILRLKNDSVAELPALADALVQLGYERTYQVETGGQFSVRGNIIDIFALTQPEPYRIEFWGDEVDSIRSFDPESQRSIENLEEITIYPAREFVLRGQAMSDGIARIKKELAKQERVLQEQMRTEEAHRLKTSVNQMIDQLTETGAGSGMDIYIRYFYEKTESFLDYFDRENALVFLDEINRLADHGEAVWTEFTESMKGRLEKGYVLAARTDVLFSLRETLGRLQRFCCVGLSALEPSQKYWSVNSSYYVHTQSVNSYQNDFRRLTEDLKRYQKLGYRVLLLAPSRTRARRRICASMS